MNVVKAHFCKHQDNQDHDLSRAPHSDLKVIGRAGNDAHSLHLRGQKTYTIYLKYHVHCMYHFMLFMELHCRWLPQTIAPAHPCSSQTTLQTTIETAALFYNHIALVGSNMDIKNAVSGKSPPWRYVLHLAFPTLGGEVSCRHSAQATITSLAYRAMSRASTSTWPLTQRGFWTAVRFSMSAMRPSPKQTVNIPPARRSAALHQSRCLTNSKIPPVFKGTHTSIAVLRLSLQTVGYSCCESAQKLPFARISPGYA